MLRYRTTIDAVSSTGKPVQRSRAGAAIVEAAVVLPLFFMIVLGIIEFGRAMMVGQMVTNAAREGARRAILDGSSNSTVEQYVENYLAGALTVAVTDIAVNFTIDPDPANTTTGNEVAAAQPYDMITVRVEVPYDKISFVSGRYLAGKQLAAQATMRHE